MAAINITDLKTEFGAYYNEGSQNLARIRKQIYFGNETAAFFQPINTQSTTYEMARDSFSRVAQPFQKNWSPAGAYTAEPVPIKLYGIKLDVEMYPDEIVESWLGFLASNDLDRKTWPLPRYLAEQHILPRHINDVERNEMFHGQYLAPPTPGTAGAAGTAMDGIRKKINDAYASDIPAENKIATGALSADPVTFVEQIETFCASIPELYRNTADIKLAFRGTNRSKWLQGMREKYNMNYTQIDASDVFRVADHPNIQVLPLASWQNSEKIVASVSANAVMPVRNMMNIGRFQIENVDRLVKIFTDYHQGIGFVRWDQVFTNDRDLSAS